MNIHGKTALITGGAHRVGKAITMELAQAGANVVVNYNTAATAADETVAEAQALGVGGLAVQADVADAEQVQGMIQAAVAQFGGVDILVNSASLWKNSPFPTKDLSDWHRITRILIDGSFYCANAVAPLMLRRGGGAIVNIVDMSAWHPFAGMIAHTVGKSALLAMTNALALELAPTITVNAVAPGPVLLPPSYSQAQADRVAGGTLLGRWGAAEDVSRAVRFLVEADYITGEVIRVDGGELFGHRKAKK